MIPNPQSSKHEFFKEVTKELFENIYIVVDLKSFKNYTKSQREVRWKIENEIRSFQRLQYLYKTAKDGN